MIFLFLINCHVLNEAGKTNDRLSVVFTRRIFLKRRKSKSEKCMSIKKETVSLVR